MTEQRVPNTLLVLFLILIAFTVTATPASARCHFACGIRHPVHSWEVQHHVARCDLRCHIYRNNNSSGSSSSNQGVYPCYITWTYNGTRYWRYHYEVGGSRNHVGFPPSNAHRCLPGQ